MNLYEYQRPRSFTDLGPRSLRFNILFVFCFFFSLETAKPIEAEFQLYPLWDKGTKVSLNGLGHMTNMAAMPVFNKKPSNFLF